MTTRTVALTLSREVSVVFASQKHRRKLVVLGAALSFGQNESSGLMLECDLLWFLLQSGVGIEQWGSPACNALLG